MSADEGQEFGPLQEASTEQLLAELGRRMDAFAFIGSVYPTDTSPGTIVRELEGNRTVCLGLLSHASYRLNLDFHGEIIQRPDEEDDET